MGVIQSTTGHDRQEERHVAYELYAAIIIAILAVAALFFLLAQHPNWNPFSEYSLPSQETPIAATMMSANH